LIKTKPNLTGIQVLSKSNGGDPDKIPFTMSMIHAPYEKIVLDDPRSRVVVQGGECLDCGSHIEHKDWGRFYCRECRKLFNTKPNLKGILVCPVGTNDPNAIPFTIVATEVPFEETIVADASRADVQTPGGPSPLVADPLSSSTPAIAIAGRECPEPILDRADADRGGGSEDNPIDYESLATALLRDRQNLPSKLVDFMKDKERAEFQDIMDGVHGGERKDGTVRTLVKRTNTLLIGLKSRLRFITEGGCVVKRIDPA
jgi:hypothetical protein